MNGIDAPISDTQRVPSPLPPREAVRSPQRRSGRSRDRPGTVTLDVPPPGL